MHNIQLRHNVKHTTHMCLVVNMEITASCWSALQVPSEDISESSSSQTKPWCCEEESEVMDNTTPQAKHSYTETLSVWKRDRNAFPYKHTPQSPVTLHVVVP